MNKTELTAKQNRMVMTLLKTRTISEALEKCRIGRSTFYGWMKDETFRCTLKECQSRLIDSAIIDIKALTNSAAQELGSVLLNTTNESTKLRAVQMIFDFVIRTKELEDIEARLEALENTLKDRKLEESRN